MKKYLKNLFTFAFLILMSMQIFGQGSWSFNCWDMHFFTELQHHLIWDQETGMFGFCDCGYGNGCGSGNGHGGPGGPGNDPNIIRFMTYNIASNNYKKNGRDVIRPSGDVIAVQEILTQKNYTELQQHSIKTGEFLVTMNIFGVKYGIAMLWNHSLGTPTITPRLGSTSNCDDDWQRGYIIAEFTKFIFVSTHFPTGDCGDKEEIAIAIVSESIIQNTNKPVFIAGDFNFSPHKPQMNIFKNANFEALNDTSMYSDWQYYHATQQDGKMIDMIIGEKNSSKYEVLNRGIPNVPNMDYSLSGHLPYVVRVKLIP